MEKTVKELFNDDILKKALSFYDYSYNEIVNKAGFESFIFEINKEDEQYILRVSHSSHREIEMIKAEIEFIDYLSKNHANVSTTILSVNKNLIKKKKN